MARDHVTAAQAASTLGVSIRTIYRYLKTGRLQGCKANGTHWRIPESELEALLPQGSITSDAGSTSSDEHSLGRRDSDGFYSGEREFIAWITETKKKKDNSST